MAGMSNQVTGGNDDGDRPKNLTMAASWFCTMNAMSRIRSTRGVMVAVQVTPARVTTGRGSADGGAAGVGRGKAPALAVVQHSLGQSFVP
jgi:hypothetical protein